MLQTISSVTYLSKVRSSLKPFLALVGLLCAHVTAFATLPPLMPWPAEIHEDAGSQRLAIDRHLKVALNAKSDPRVSEALVRLTHAWTVRVGDKISPAFVSSALATLSIEWDRPSPAIPVLGEDESYTLNISASQAKLHATTTVGVLRGLATFQQLLQVEDGKRYLPSLQIRDQPRFPWRGFMLDVSRHWQPIEVVERELDGMALVKLNVFHFHLTDDQGFRIESLTHPELTAQGSDGKFFTQKQIREIIAYASARGIRVLPEFDIPGHATSWVVSHPELASLPGPYKIERQWGVFDPVLDPTNEKTYLLLADFLGEMAALFPDEYLHIGGDENNGVQWKANPRIQAYIKEHALKNNEGLHSYFNQRVFEILKQHKKHLIGWDEILNPGLPSESVIDSWRGTSALAEAARRGYAGILANGFYIDLNYPAAEHYLSDPLPVNTTLTSAEQSRILGGEAPMWAEWVGPDNIDTRIWPRTAVIAERLWSPRETRDVDSMYTRLSTIDFRLQEAGLQQANWPKFPGLARDSETAKALTTLANAVEPVKGYKRGGLQKDHVQSTPLNLLADWSRPDSVDARHFNNEVATWFASGGQSNALRSSGVETQLLTWKQAGERAAKYFAQADAVSAAQRKTALALAALSDVGLSALQALASTHALSAEQSKAAQLAINDAAVPTASAVEFTFLHSLRLLVASASEPKLAPTLTPDAWRQETEARAAAATAPVEAPK